MASKVIVLSKPASSSACAGTDSRYELRQYRMVTGKTGKPETKNRGSAPVPQLQSDYNFSHFKVVAPYWRKGLSDLRLLRIQRLALHLK